MSFSPPPPPQPSPSRGADPTSDGGSNSGDGNNGDSNGGNSNGNNGNNNNTDGTGGTSRGPPVLANNTVPATDNSIKFERGQWQEEDACSASDDDGGSVVGAVTVAAQTTTEVGATIEHEFFGAFAFAMGRNLCSYSSLLSQAPLST
jgi:hypothetical protein